MPQRLNRRTLVLGMSATAATVAHKRIALAEEASPIASPAPIPDVLPDTPAGRRLAWVFAVMNGELPIPTADELPERFAPVFLQAVPPASLITIIQQLQAQFVPIELLEVVGIATPYALSVLFSVAGGARVVASITVNAAEPHLIEGLVFFPADSEEIEIPPLTSWDELDAALVAAGGEPISVQAGHVNQDGSLTPIHEVNADINQGIGSAFKLYVLGALAESIEAGDLAWETEIEVVENLLSLPSGITQSEPIGSKLQVKELAQRMIAMSDNTATDLLLHAVGREAVEEVQRTLGHASPELNVPFLTTREIFQLKLGNADRRAEFIAAGEAERRAILEALASEPLPTIDKAIEWTTPIDVNEIEWFASAADLSSALIWLRDAWSRPGLEPIKEILSFSPGVPVDPAVWKMIAYKGGSEPGVLATAWLAERHDGAVFTLVGIVTNPIAPIDEEPAVIALAGAFALLAEA